VTDCLPGTVSRLIYASHGSRCDVRVNPKRPTWRCKSAPTWIWIADEKEPDGRSKFRIVCDEHRLTLRCEDAA
jgi:hypothetical protein